MKCVIIGAGKIARGFIGHLLFLSGIEFTFIEKAQALVDLINERGAYTVNILGDSEKNTYVTGAKAVSFSDEKSINRLIAEADCVFTAVGGKNLKDIVPILASGISEKAKSGGCLNIVTCENWKEPAALLRDAVSERLEGEAYTYFEKNVGVTEAVIMRSAIEAGKELLEKDPLIVNVQSFWELPVDASRVIGELPKIEGLKLVKEFTGFLERKFYTYNAANGTTSFVGALLGYEKLADAAHDERIVKLLDGVYRETAQALCKKHGMPFEEQWAFTRTSLKKLQDYTIVDYIERNARDPIRKLGPDDRLVGSARLVEASGIVPDSLSWSIAAAIYYFCESDESALELKKMREEKGVDYVLENVCRLDKNGLIARLVKEKISKYREEGLIHE